MKRRTDQAFDAKDLRTQNEHDTDDSGEDANTNPWGMWCEHQFIVSVAIDMLVTGSPKCKRISLPWHAIWSTFTVEQQRSALTNLCGMLHPILSIHTEPLVNTDRVKLIVQVEMEQGQIVRDRLVQQKWQATLLQSNTSHEKRLSTPIEDQYLKYWNMHWFLHREEPKEPAYYHPLKRRVLEMEPIQELESEPRKRLRSTDHDDDDDGLDAKSDTDADFENDDGDPYITPERDNAMTPSPPPPPPALYDFDDRFYHHS